jgi:4-amino-4-deoxy-L-arabinose transferase-like glycosyltransferase
MMEPSDGSAPLNLAVFPAPWNRAAMIGLLGAALLWVLYGYPLLVDIPLLEPDEGLHAAISQEMVERGDWVTPRFLLAPFWDKPPLFFWAQAASMSCLGMNEAAARLPGLLLAVLAVLTTGVLGWRLFDRATGMLAGFFQATLILPLALAQAAVHDVFLVPLVSLAILGLWRAIMGSGSRQRLTHASVAGGMLGLACLAKGLLGMAGVLLTVGAYLLIKRQLTARSLALLTLAAMIAALLASPWYVMMEVRNPGYLHYYFVKRHLGGFFTSTQQHGNAAWWYYLPVLFGGGLPWIAYLPAAARDWLEGHRVESRSDEPTALLWVWLIVYTGFLFLAQSKLLTYLLPVFPAVALLAAVAWVKFSRGELSAASTKLMIAAFRLSTWATPIVLPIGIALLQRQFDLRFPISTVAIACLVGFSSWLLQRRLEPTRLMGMAARAGVVMAAVFVVAMTLIVPPVAREISGRELAEYFNRRRGLPIRLFMAESRYGSMVFYLDPALRLSLRDDQIVPLVVPKWSAALADPPGSMLAVPRQRMRMADQRVDLQGARVQRMGRYRLYWAEEVAARLARSSAASGAMPR